MLTSQAFCHALENNLITELESIPDLYNAGLMTAEELNVIR